SYGSEDADLMRQYISTIKKSDWQQCNRKAHESNANSGSANLWRLNRERRVNVNLIEFEGNSSSEDADFVKHTYRPLRNRIGNNVSRDDAVSSKRKRALDTKLAPRQEGVRTHRSKSV
ncbi:hypothetical protein RYX36_018536, partial [Vicia faba]